jgi:hypothetical protein
MTPEQVGFWNLSDENAANAKILQSGINPLQADGGAAVWRVAVRNHECVPSV